MNDSTHEDPKIESASIVDILAPEEDSTPFVPRQRRTKLPIFLFFATCATTFLAGRMFLGEGLKYAIPLMVILVCHEMGHFLQSRRYGVFASYPYFIPFMPPIGTMGAVIFMEPRMGRRRALFDIGITGPLAGLIPTIICCIVGIRFSEAVHIPAGEDLSNYGLPLGEPLLFRYLVQWVGPHIPSPDYHLRFDAIAFAGWVGLLITSINLVPIGQLDGGHVLYALLRKDAHFVATLLLFAALMCVGIFHLWGWSVMLILLILIGPQHPPTADDDEPLGVFRHILGWLTLAFVIIGFTPQPFFPS